jgi:hypothetical protein
MGTKPNHELMSIDCKNCETVFEGRFCPQCGQKATTGRLTVGHVLEEGWHSVTHTDKSFLSLLGAMIRQPGLVINEFITGKRSCRSNCSTWHLSSIIMIGMPIRA